MALFVGDTATPFEIPPDMDQALDMYAAIGVGRLDCPEMPLGEGVMLRQCTATVFSTTMLAYSRPDAPGKITPAPWVPIHNDSASIHVDMELFVPQGVEWPGMERSALLWWITHLLRIRQRLPLFLPAVSNRTFVHPPDNGLDSSVRRAERMHVRKWWDETWTGPTLTEETVVWVQNTWRPAAALWSNASFRALFQAFDLLYVVDNPSLAIVLLWGALENAFLQDSSKGEITFKISAYLASFLEPMGANRGALAIQLKRLYGARSKAAHGEDKDLLKELVETEKLFRRVLIKIIDDKTMPTHESLRTALLGG